MCPGVSIGRKAWLPTACSRQGREAAVSPMSFCPARLAWAGLPSARGPLPASRRTGPTHCKNTKHSRFEGLTGPPTAWPREVDVLSGERTSQGKESGFAQVPSSQAAPGALQSPSQPRCPRGTDMQRAWPSDSTHRSPSLRQCTKHCEAQQSGRCCVSSLPQKQAPSRHAQPRPSGSTAFPKSLSSCLFSSQAPGSQDPGAGGQASPAPRRGALPVRGAYRRISLSKETWFCRRLVYRKGTVLWLPGDSPQAVV